jgi:MFS family permease
MGLAAAEAAAQRPAAHLSGRQQLTLSVLWLGLNFQTSALLSIVIPVQITLFVAAGQAGNAQQASFLAWLGAFTGMISLVLTPLVGALSDHTVGGLGRRRPYIALGAVGLLSGAIILAAPTGAPALVLGLTLLTLGGTVATAGYQGLMPDIVPETQRGAASGYIAVMTILGNVGSLILAGLLLAQATGSAGAESAARSGAAIFYFLTGIVVAGSVLITIFGVHETPLLSLPAHAPTFRQRLDAAWLAPWRHHNFRWVFLTRCSVMMGLTLYMTFIAYFFANVEQIANFAAVTAALAVLALVGAAASGYLLGLASDRVGRVWLVCLASACMAAAALAFVVLPVNFPLWQLLPLGVLFGIGYGAYYSVDWALAVDVLPSLNDAGKDMGLWSMASNLPAVLAPAIGGAVFSIAGGIGATRFGYRFIFALAAAFLLAGAVFVLLVREPASRRLLRQRRIAPGWRLAFRTRAGTARGFLRFWPFYEWLWLRVHRVQIVPGAPEGLLRIGFSRYQGQPITLPDGTHIAPGDRIGELHINNPVIARLAQEGHALRLLPLFVISFRALAAWSRTPDFPADVQAVFGFTLLGRACARLGFTLRERPHTLRTWLDRFFMTGLLALYNPSGTGRLRQGNTYGSYPVEVWMSRGELQRRYGADRPSAAH